MAPRAATQRQPERDELGRPIKHTDPEALRILAAWVAGLDARRGRGPSIERDFVVMG